MFLQIHEPGQIDANQTRILLRCPFCRHQGTFDIILGTDGLLQAAQIRYGFRRCPNDTCRALVFFIWKQGQLVESFPPELIDFDATGIPDNVVGAFKESIVCHAHQAYSAAAIMVRKTLELVCKDRGAKGKDLKERITALESHVVISRELIEASHDLRLLGNDAAHVEAQVYDEIGSEEIEVAIDLTKEILKAVYQHKSLLLRLRALKADA